MRWVFIVASGVFILLFSSCTRNNSSGEKVVKETFLHRYGIEVSPKDWAYRGKDGKIITKLSNGVVVVRTYLGGALHGDSTYTFPHSDAIEKILTYSDGLLNKEVINYRSGISQKEIKYFEEDRKVVTEWYGLGALKSRSEFLGQLLINGEFYNLDQQQESKVESGEGVRMNRDSYGQILSSEEIKSGQVVLCTLFHPNGFPKEVIPYENGIVTGTKRTFYPGGEPFTVEEWEENQQNGLTTVYQNGMKLSEVQYRKGVKNGLECRYREGTTLVQKITWKNDLRHGPCYTYFESGTNIDWYYLDEKVDKKRYSWLVKNHGR